jgi:hypothetical protein
MAAASAEFDRRPGKSPDEIPLLTKAWLIALQGEIAFARKKKQVKDSVVRSQLAFELNDYVQEANWASPARLEVRMDSLFSCKALASPTRCRFSSAHSELPVIRL